jgi:hypothetical protein
MQEFRRRGRCPDLSRASYRSVEDWSQLPARDASTCHVIRDGAASGDHQIADPHQGRVLGE